MTKVQGMPIMRGDFMTDTVVLLAPVSICHITIWTPRQNWTGL